MNLAEISRKRKEELLSLRSKLKKNDNSTSDGKADSSVELPKPKFRSYQPTSEVLKTQVMQVAQPADIKSQIASDVSNRALSNLDNIDFADLAPRKPDWDLKRAIEPKLRKLERRTEKAIAEIVRERLQLEAANKNDETDTTEAMSE